METQDEKIPFILLFLEECIGTEGATTSGSWSDVDAADNT
jgi:hypothetical protein